MGLDMYAFATRDPIDTAVDFQSADSQKIHYWRKHPDSHGWMENLYYDKGGSADCFNCVSVALDYQDLNRLETAIHMSELPATGGFFFGQSDGSENDDDLEFIRKARKAIGDKKTVFYTSWW